MSRLDEHGHETLDPTPLQLPSGFKRPETLAETVARLVRSHELNKAVQEAGYETFEEADDFDIPDDPPDPATPYEPQFDPLLGVELTPQDVVTREKQIADATEKALERRKAAQKAKEEQKAPPATPPAAEPPKAPPA